MEQELLASTNVCPDVDPLHLAFVGDAQPGECVEIWRARSEIGRQINSVGGHVDLLPAGREGNTGGAAAPGHNNIGGLRRVRVENDDERQADKRTDDLRRQ